jgi:hypothetical protein
LAAVTGQRDLAASTSFSQHDSALTAAVLLLMESQQQPLPQQTGPHQHSSWQASPQQQLSPQQQSNGPFDFSAATATPITTPLAAFGFSAAARTAITPAKANAPTRPNTYLRFMIRLLS